MSHDHEHDHGNSHDHKHAHDHTHEHEHGHDGHHHHHEHDHENGKEMAMEEKLAVLLSHWVDHNDSHKDNFFSWAKKAKDAGFTEIAAHLEQAGTLSETVTQQLKQAQKVLHG